MSKIKYIAFFKEDAVFDSERIVGELIDVCEQINLGEDGIMCRMQAVQGELVYCKDCKNYYPEDKPYQKRGCMYGGICEKPDDFCSRGEKR